MLEGAVGATQKATTKRAALAMSILSGMVRFAAGECGVDNPQGVPAAANLKEDPRAGSLAAVLLGLASHIFQSTNSMTSGGGGPELGQRVRAGAGDSGQLSSGGP